MKNHLKGFTKEQISNLVKLADYLYKGNLSGQFDMCYLNEGLSYRVNTPHTCGTSGCALGYAPEALKISLDDKEAYVVNEYEKRIEWNFDYISEKYLGINKVESGVFNDMFKVMGFLFSIDFWEIDNTPEGAALRIYYFLEHGLPNCEYDKVKSLYKDQQRYNPLELEDM